MEYRTLENTYISMRNKDGEVLNNCSFIVARSGYGKGMSSETLAEEYHREGYTVLVLADPKDEIEWGYAMFPPEKKYHLRELRKCGKEPGTKPVKLYHPFTFNIPRYDLPETTFYTFSLKELGREEWSMLAETDYDTDTIKLLMNTSRNISKQDGLYGFVHYLDSYARGKTDGKKVKADPRLFHLRITGGKQSSVQDIANYLQPFRDDYFLSADSSPLKLDWKEILNDNAHYHVFTTCWLSPRDRKLKEFCAAALFNQIMYNKRHAKRPLLIILPEVRFLMPFNPKGYQYFMSKMINSQLVTMRSKGQGGMSAILDTQVFSDVDTAIMNTATKMFLGELGGPKDIESISRALKYPRPIQERLTRMGTGERFMTYMLVGNEKDNPVRFWVPSHRHAEPGYDFFKTYREECPEKLKNYSALVKQVQELADKEEAKFRDRVKQQEKDEKERAEKIRKEKEERKSGSKGADEKLEKAKDMMKKSKSELMRLVYEFRQKNPSVSWREIGREFDIDDKTAKIYVQKHCAALAAGQDSGGEADQDAVSSKEPDDDRDFEDNALKDLSVK